MNKLLFLFLLCGILSAEPLTIEEYTLVNGMRVILSPMEDEEEVFIQLTARGGFASLPPGDQASGRVAPDVVWEIGLDQLSAEQISSQLYQASSDLQASIYPLYRKIEGSSWHEETKIPLSIITLMFTEPKLSVKDLNEGLRSLKYLYQSENRFSEWNFEIESHLLNSQNWPPFLPLTKEKLDQVKISVIQNFYRKAFSNPADFVCVVTGRFEKNKMKLEIEESLGKIPATHQSYFLVPPPFPAFPTDIAKKVLVQKERRDAICRFTFPIKTLIEEQNVASLNNLSLIIESVCREAIFEKMGVSHGVDVSYEFPFFPYLDNPWLIVQFHSEPKDLESISEIILSTITFNVDNGITEAKLTKAWNHVDENDSNLNEDAESRLIELSNLSLFKWDLKTVQNLRIPRKLSVEESSKLIKDSIDPKIYTRIIAKP